MVWNHPIRSDEIDWFRFEIFSKRLFNGPVMINFCSIFLKKFFEVYDEWDFSVVSASKFSKIVVF